MKRVMIIGCPGSGKSTLARRLHQITGLPLVYLDRLYWNADRTTVSKDEFRRRLIEAVADDEWIIDGNYSATVELRLAACDTVVFLDYPVEVCLEGVRMRRGQVRPDMPWIETDEDPEFTEFIRSFATERRPALLELLAQYNRDVHVFHDHAEADAFLRQLELSLI